MGVIEVFDGGCISSASCFEAYIDEVKDRGSLFGRRVSGREGDVIPFPERGFPVLSVDESTTNQHPPPLSTLQLPKVFLIAYLFSLNLHYPHASPQRILNQ